MNRGISYKFLKTSETFSTQHRIMKTTRDVLESNYCNMLSQKHRQVLKPLAGVTLLALIVSFDVISHHEECNPSCMMNWAICMVKDFLTKYHQIKHLHHFCSESDWSSAWPSLSNRCGNKGMSEDGACWFLTHFQMGIHHKPGCVAAGGPGIATQNCS